MPPPAPPSSVPLSLARRVQALVITFGAAAGLAACGGGGTEDTLQAAAAAATASTSAAGTAVSALQASWPVQPTYHLAPVLLDEPAQVEAGAQAAAGHRPPHRQSIPSDQAGLNTRGLTAQDIAAAQRRRALASRSAADGSPVGPAAGHGSTATYSPAQIRAAYGLPELPASFGNLTAEQAARFGAGQTIYVIAAHHDPQIVAELNAFNSRFGLPACETRTIAATATLPLATPTATAGCQFSVVYSTVNGTLATRAPAYNASWATEIALDVQWAHAIAPMARIVLIEAAQPMSNHLTGAVKLANAMGPGVVSMSFGASELDGGAYSATLWNPVFSGRGMTYLAATGDWGSDVFWPAASPHVLAIGGTRLSWDGSSARSETGWSTTGGGISAYTAVPSYQASGLPGVGALERRGVADVAFNADPETGQYTAVMSPGSSAVSWVSAGGTSLSTPQWAGLLAVANARRSLAGKAVLGLPHDVLYRQIGAVPGLYASTLSDITSGSNGSCMLCTAREGYDVLTGLGTPNAAPLLDTLTRATSSSNVVVKPTTAPLLPSPNVVGKVGNALTFEMGAVAANPVTYTMTGAPAGMTLSAAGRVTWPRPVFGNHTVKVTAKDSRTGLTGSGTATVGIAGNPPVVTAATVSGREGTALSYKAVVKSDNPVTWTASGAPAGLAVSAAGVLTWARPTPGSHALTLTATDSRHRLAGSATVKLNIAKLPKPPVVHVTPVTGQVGRPLSALVSVSNPDANGLRVTVAGAPAGLRVAVDSSGITLTWASPVRGRWTLGVIATNGANLTARASIPLTINP